MQRSVTITLPGGITITCAPNQVIRQNQFSPYAPPLPNWTPIGVAPPSPYHVVPQGYFDPEWTPLVTC